MATKIVDIVTIVEALRVAERDFLGFERRWEHVNDEQRRLAGLYKRFREDVSRMENLKAMASKDVAALNAFLRASGFDIQLTPIPDPEGFGVVAILDRLVKWLTAGDERAIRVDMNTYPAFRLESGVSFFTINGKPAVRMETKSGDAVWLALADSELSGLALVEKILNLSSAQKAQDFGYKGVVIPEVMIDQKPDISFLLGMKTIDTAGRGWFIQQALQHAKFAMNREGARIRVATAVMVMRSMAMPKPDLIFDRPFYLWIMGREGSQLPVAMMYVDTDCWRRADLNAL